MASPEVKVEAIRGVLNASDRNNAQKGKDIFNIISLQWNSDWLDDHDKEALANKAEEACSDGNLNDEEKVEVMGKYLDSLDQQQS